MKKFIVEKYHLVILKNIRWTMNIFKERCDMHKILGLPEEEREGAMQLNAKRNCIVEAIHRSVCENEDMRWLCDCDIQNKYKEVLVLLEIICQNCSIVKGEYVTDRGGRWMLQVQRYTKEEDGTNKDTKHDST